MIGVSSCSKSAVAMLVVSLDSFGKIGFGKLYWVLLQAMSPLLEFIGEGVH